jgi:hypothetical protein
MQCPRSREGVDQRLVAFMPWFRTIPRFLCLELEGFYFLETLIVAHCRLRFLSSHKAYFACR